MGELADKFRLALVKWSLDVITDRIGRSHAKKRSIPTIFLFSSLSLLLRHTRTHACTYTYTLSLSPLFSPCKVKVRVLVCVRELVNLPYASCSLAEWPVRAPSLSIRVIQFLKQSQAGSAHLRLEGAWPFNLFLVWLLKKALQPCEIQSAELLQ